jgi:hypothetical protein
MDEDVRMDEDDIKQEMYDNIDIIRELTFGIDENKFATKFNEEEISNVDKTEEKFSKMIDLKLEPLLSRYTRERVSRNVSKAKLLSILFFINRDFILPYNAAYGLMYKSLNNKGRYSTKTFNEYKLLLDKETYDKIYTFSLGGVDMDRIIRILDDIFENDTINEELTINEINYIGLILRYKVYNVHNNIRTRNENIENIIRNNPELITFNEDEIKYIYTVFHFFSQESQESYKIANAIELENHSTIFNTELRLNKLFNETKGILNWNIILSKNFMLNIFMPKFMSIFTSLNNEDKKKLIFYLISYYNINPWEQGNNIPEIDFLEYETNKVKFPGIKNYKNKISKKSIMDFLLRSEVSEEEIQDWNAIFRQQHGDAAIPPPPPDWWLLSRSADVHTKKHVRITDCRIKLLMKNQTSKYIENIAEEIENETARLAYKNGKEDNVVNLTEYVKENTVTKDEILKCRVDENSPRYYGYGEIYDNERASRLPVDERVEICDIVIKIWEVIQSTKNTQMYETLVIQFIGAFKEHISKGVCNQGWVGGLTSIFGSYSKDLGYLCITEKEQEIEELVSMFLIDMKDDIIPVQYPTVNKLFVEISNILLDAKYEDDWDYASHTPEENSSFDEKVKMYDILYEDDTAPKELKIKTMKEFIDCMLPTFFMRALDYFENKETTIKLKEAVKSAIETFKQFQIDKICGSSKR